MLIISQPSRRPRTRGARCELLAAWVPALGCQGERVAHGRAAGLLKWQPRLLACAWAGRETAKRGFILIGIGVAMGKRSAEERRWLSGPGRCVYAKQMVDCFPLPTDYGAGSEPSCVAPWECRVPIILRALLPQVCYPGQRSRMESEAPREFCRCLLQTQLRC